MSELYFSTGKIDFLFFGVAWEGNKKNLINKFYISDRDNIAEKIQKDSPSAKFAKYQDMEKLTEQLFFWLQGELPVLSLESLDLSKLNNFEKKVLCELRKRVGRGKTVSYGELANSAGCPGGARAVGNVMRKNPFPLFFPCHRVVKSDGSLGNFSPGPELKKRLLEQEHV